MTPHGVTVQAEPAWALGFKVDDHVRVSKHDGAQGFRDAAKLLSLNASDAVPRKARSILPIARP